MWNRFKAQLTCRLVGHHEAPVDRAGWTCCLRCGRQRTVLRFQNGTTVTGADSDPSRIRSHTHRLPTSGDQLIVIGMRVAQAGMPLAWLYAQHPELEYLTPAEACQAGQVDQVLELVEQWIEYQIHHDV